VIAVLQETSDQGAVRAKLHSFVRAGELRLDWGKCFALFEAGAIASAKHPHPLTLRFPELTGFASQMSDVSSEWFRAERFLRDCRNKQAHLQRHPDIELGDLSDECFEKLDSLLDAVSFIGTRPLVHVADYELNPVSLERIATFEMLQGISPVFSRMRCKVQSELPRGAVGFLNHQENFVSALPWLTMRSCPVCKRAELFVFSRYERGSATYIAMETGHPHSDQLLGRSVGAMIFPQSTVTEQIGGSLLH
jgi:hypothetical protein